MMYVRDESGKLNPIQPMEKIIMLSRISAFGLMLIPLGMSAHAGTWVTEGDMRIFADGISSNCVSAPATDDQKCAPPMKLLESVSGTCVPDNLYTTTSCDVCCDPNLDLNCKKSTTVEEYLTGQLTAAEAALTAPEGGNAQVHLARSIALSNISAYSIRVYGSKTDAEKLFQIYRRINKIYLHTKAEASKRKSLNCKTDKCPILDLAIISASTSQGASVELLKRAWQDLLK